MRFLTTILASAAIAAAMPAAAQTVDVRCPQLDDKQLGHIRNIVALAEQPGFDTMEPGPRGTFEQFQFQLAWMYYALAVAQTQDTPAYRELYKRTSDLLIQKMLRPEAWGHWSEVIADPRFTKYLDAAKDWRDPVREKNIMYSGHLLQMVGLYERLYGDRKYERNGSISFAMTGPGGFKHDYSFGSLATLIRDQFIASDLAGIECEPNFVFAECNQHPVLGLIDYDKLHGTKLADLKEGFWKKATELGYLNGATSRFAGPYLRKEGVTGKLTAAWNDGWTGVTLNAWQPDVVARVYPIQRDQELARLVDQTPATWLVRWSSPSVSTDFGFLAAYAAELDDQQTKRTLLDYADLHFKPVWRDGRLYYPRHDVEVTRKADQVTGQEGVGPFKKPAVEALRPDQMGEHFVAPLMGNALIAFARLNPGRGLWHLYNNLPAYNLKDPELVGVAYPDVIVRQAYYDAAAHRLVIGIEPGNIHGGLARFAVRNLSRSASYTVTVDRQIVARVRHGGIAPMTGATSVAWGGNGDLTIGMPLIARRQITVAESAGAESARSVSGDRDAPPASALAAAQ